jgi:pimeloyl-ACP methyl ester carboxylesterase
MDAVVIIDPVFQTTGGGQAWARASTFRRDHWPSRKLAAEKLRSSPALKSWDPIVLEKFIEFGLRDCPTELYPDVPKEAEDVPVTLQTTKAQEVYNYVQPTYRDPRLLIPGHLQGRDFHPEDVAAAGKDANFMRGEMAVLWRRLEELQPSALFIFGGKSEVSGEVARAEKLARTGRGVGGNGGVETGMVKEVVLECGHLVPLERPMETAVACAEFVDAEVGRWVEEEGERRRVWESLGKSERVDLNDLWKEKIGGPPKKGAKGKSETKL